MQNLKKKKKMHACKAAAGEPLLEISIIYATIVCNDIPLLEAISNFKSCSQDLKQLCIDRSHIHGYTYLPQN